MTEPKKPRHTTRPRIVAGLAGSSLLAIGAAGYLVGTTVAAYSDKEFASATFVSVVPASFNIEGSADGVTWSDNPATIIPTQFSSNSMTMRVGPENAAYTPVLLRAKAGTTLGGTATMSETGLSTTEPFAQALEGEVYSDTADCSAAGTATATPIAAGKLQGLTTPTFDIAAPTVTSQPGATQSLCLKIWINHTYPLDGTQTATATAQWVIDATATGV